jgi:hypothetical protein
VIYGYRTDLGCTAKSRMADDRLPCCRSASIPATSSVNSILRPPAISFQPLEGILKAHACLAPRNDD